jgi:maltose/maltodextrin transport system permease protein
MSAPADAIPQTEQPPYLRLAVVALITLGLLYAAFHLYLIAQPLFAVALLTIGVLFGLIYSRQQFYNARFIFPGVAAVMLFVALPIGYTIWIGFTNYSSFNLLTFDRAKSVLLSRGSVDKSTEQPFAVVDAGDGTYQIWLPEAGLLSEPVSLTEALEEATLEVTAKDAIKLRTGLQTLTLLTPDGIAIQNSGLRTFASLMPDYRELEDDQLERIADGVILKPDHEQGFYFADNGERIPPGWYVNIGWNNFDRIFNSAGIREPMIGIFIWTVVFATASVALTFSVGLALGVVLQWEHLRGKAIYRILLILPYAVPSFISILVFRGLFNQNFGEINLILEGLFGVRPEWFTDANLARTMILIVNTWLGYPYMMLLAMGFLQGVPQDHKKAAALEGASASRVFFKITLPQILPPFMPLLIASFAFNFNNMVLVLLLTRGLPDIVGTTVPAGQTDILASFTYRIAFGFSSTEFGLAGAITLLIFVLVSVISYVNFVAMRRGTEKRVDR